MRNMRRLRMHMTLAAALLALRIAAQQPPSPSASEETDLAAAERIGTAHAQAAVANVNAFVGDHKFSAAADIIVAQGDSWFAYPRYNVLKYLEWKHGFRVESTAHNGEWLETMAYDEDQLSDLALTLKRVADQGRKPRAILLSGGGNDIAGIQLTMLLTHRQSGQKAVDAVMAQQMLAVRLRRDMATLIIATKALSKTYFNDPDIPIFIHGYDRPVPDGRGFLGGFWFLPGPWLRPSFDMKGYDHSSADEQAATDAMAELIGRYNDTLERLATSGVKNVYYIKVIGTLHNDGTYKKDWGNELHPTKSGFETVARLFAKAINDHPH